MFVITEKKDKDKLVMTVWKDIPKIMFLIHYTTLIIVGIMHLLYDFVNGYRKKN